MCMEIKILEIRDIATFIPLLCVNLGRADNGKQRYYMRRVGYPLNGRPNIAVCRLSCNNDKITSDPYQHDSRTYRVAHDYIIKHWVSLVDGDVIDVEFILGETKTKKKSEFYP